MRSLEHQGVKTIFGYPGGSIMPVLADKDKLSITGDGNGIHPVWIFQYIIGGDVVAVG